MTREEIEAQTAAYPDIRPIVVKADVSVVYPAALQAAKDLGWRILDTAPPGTRGGGTALIDAASSDWVFRFEDEIAIRLTPGEGGTTIDVRSVSGAGSHDFGANARRIRAYAAALKESAPAR